MSDRENHLNAESIAVYSELASSRNRRDTWFLRAIVIVGFIGIVLIGAVAWILWQQHTEIGTVKDVVHHISVQSNYHTETLNHIDALTKAASRVLSFSQLGLAEGKADYQAICNHIPGCTLPYPFP